MAKRRAGSQIASLTPTRKNKKSTQFTCMQTAYDILLESSQQGLQLCFKLHLDSRSARKVMKLQNHGSPNLINFGTPTWESRDKKSFGCGPRGEVQSIL
jgi:hypothetical protein